MLDLFIDGIAAIATPDTLALMILGVIVGIIFGSVPGLTAVTGIALFLPVTYSLGPIKGMALLMAACNKKDNKAPLGGTPALRWPYRR